MSNSNPEVYVVKQSNLLRKVLCFLGLHVYRWAPEGVECMHCPATKSKYACQADWHAGFQPNFVSFVSIGLIGQEATDEAILSVFDKIEEKYSKAKIEVIFRAISCNTFAWAYFEAQRRGWRTVEVYSSEENFKRMNVAADESCEVFGRSIMDVEKYFLSRAIDGVITIGIDGKVVINTTDQFLEKQMNVF